MNTDSMITEFAELFSTLKALSTGDKFLIQTLDQQLQQLLRIFIYYSHGQQAVKRQNLLFQLANIATTLSIFHQLGKITSLAYLDSEHKLLSLQKSVLNTKPIVKKPSLVIHQPMFQHKKTAPVTNPTKKKILGFIHRDSETLNSDVFSHFKDLSKRTLKRHLSDLIETGYISREAEGKRVYYKKLGNEGDYTGEEQRYS